MPKLTLDRAQLASLFQNNHQAIVAFEKIISDTSTVLPTTIEEAAAQANQALAIAGNALSLVAQLLASIEALETAPAREPVTLSDDTAPALQIGSIAPQNADNVEITGGTVNGTSVGLVSAADAMFKKLGASDQITSTVATGTAPLVIASTTRVANLNVAASGTADSLTSPTTFPAAATDLPTVITLANALRAAAISKGL